MELRPHLIALRLRFPQRRGNRAPLIDRTAQLEPDAGRPVSIVVEFHSCCSGEGWQPAASGTLDTDVHDLRLVLHLLQLRIVLPRHCAGFLLGTRDAGRVGGWHQGTWVTSDCCPVLFPGPCETAFLGCKAASCRS